jgi:dTDP-4-dehydrorhamnose reductase
MDVYYLGLLIKMCLDKKVTNRLFQVSTNDIETLHGFSKHYSDVFGVSKDMFTKGRWTFPLNQTQSTTQVEDKLFFKLDTANLEGFLNIELPTIKESLEFTYSRLGGQSVKKANSQGSDGIKFI